MSQFAKKIKLTNGLTVIFEKNENANVVAAHLGVKVGSATENETESGLSHLIEHMVFKGTTSFGPGEIATTIEAHGGELNAYTSWDETVYYVNLPSEHFLVALKVLGEMAFHATMDDTELDREKEVVLEEIRRGKDSPQRVLSETLFELFFKKHPYRRPIIGTQELIKGYDRDTVFSFYKKHYTPQNMVLAVCGNISESRLSQGLEDIFRFAVGAPSVLLHMPTEPPKTVVQIKQAAMDINATYLNMAFKAPCLSHPDVPALDLLSHLLGEADTSLLHQETKEKQQLVHSISSSCYTPRHPGLFMISCQLDPKKTNLALSSICEQIASAKSHPFPEEKLARARLLARAQLIFERQTCEGTAKKWVTYEVLANDFRYDEKYIEELNKVTTDELQKVAKKYLNLNLATVVVVGPKNTPIKIDKSVFSPAVKKKQQRYGTKIKQIQETALFRLSNGMRITLTENHRLPIMAIKTASLAGLRYETSRNNGINQMLASLLTRGTENLSLVQLSEKCEWLAGGLSSYAGRNSLGFSFAFLSDKTTAAMDLLAEVIKKPAFEPSEIEKEKKLILEAIKNRTDSTAQTAQHLVLEQLFRGHPYRWHLLGEKDSVKALTATQLRSYYKNFVVPENMVISVVGDFDSAEMLRLLDHHFAELKKGRFEHKKLPCPKPLPFKKPVTQLKVREQTNIAFGFYVPSFHHRDKHALELINNILSGQGGRLFLELRDKQSLAYSVGASLVQGLDTGFFYVAIATDPSKVNKAIEGIYSELSKLRAKLVDTKELDRTKNYMLGNHALENQKNASVAMQMALNEVYQLGISEFYEFEKNVKKVTREDIRRVAQKYLNPGHHVMAIVGPSPA